MERNWTTLNKGDILYLLVPIVNNENGEVTYEYQESYVINIKVVDDKIIDMNKRLTKGNDKTLCGVCSGLAEYFDIDVTLIRIIFVCLIFGSTFGLLLYILLAISMPKNN